MDKEFKLIFHIAPRTGKGVSGFSKGIYLYGPQASAAQTVILLRLFNAIDEDDQDEALECCREYQATGARFLDLRAATSSVSNQELLFGVLHWAWIADAYRSMMLLVEHLIASESSIDRDFFACLQVVFDQCRTDNDHYFYTEKVVRRLAVYCLEQNQPIELFGRPGGRSDAIFRHEAAIAEASMIAHHMEPRTSPTLIEAAKSKRL